MKKVFCILLVLVLALSLALPVFASEAETDEETGITSIPLFNCDQKPSGSNSLQLDKTDKTEGEASLTFAVNAGVVNEMNLPEAVDGSEYDTLEFDLYVSDPKLFDLFGEGGMDSSLEITSSGVCDNQELAWSLSAIKFSNQGGEIVEGWNHIILPFSSGKEDAGTKDGKSGPFDKSNINFMRFYMVNEKSSTGITVKIDNFRLSDWDAITSAERKEAANRTSAGKVVEKIEALAEVTADNYESVKKDVEAARRAYDRLNDEAEAYVPQAMLNKLIAAETAIADFEANPPSDEQPDETPEENPEENPEEDTGDTTGDDATADSKGCKGMVGVGAVAIMVMALSLGVSVLKKR